MPRYKRDEALEADEPKLDISSLIDAVFLLLIYFLVTTTIQPREQDVQMQLPSPNPSGKPPVIAPMLIRVDAAGAISVGGRGNIVPMDSDPDDRAVPLLFSNLRSYADATKAANAEPVVQIYVDGEAQQQRVIDVLNALSHKDVAITKVTFTDVIDTE